MSVQVHIVSGAIDVTALPWLGTLAPRPGPSPTAPAPPQPRSHPQPLPQPQPCSLTPPDPAQPCGARVRFEGIVRPLEDRRLIRAIHYELYRPMADRQLARMAEETLATFRIVRIGVVHSEGRVPAGACSFLLLVESPHRAAALDAVTHFIDRMKSDAPIWKHPEWAD